MLTVDSVTDNRLRRPRRRLRERGRLRLPVRLRPGDISRREFPAQAQRARLPEHGGKQPGNDPFITTSVDPFIDCHRRQNSGKDSNGCQFFISLRELPALDGKHVVFGRVIEGLDIVQRIGSVRTVNEKPAYDVVIAQCGEM